MVLVGSEAGSLVFQRALLTRLAGIEAKVNALRGKALDAIERTLRGAGRAERWLTITTGVTTANLTWLALMTEFWTDSVLRGVRAYLDALSEWAQSSQRLIVAYVAQLQTVLQVDLMPAIVAGLAVAAAASGNAEAVPPLLALEASGALPELTFDMLSQGGMAAISTALIPLAFAVGLISPELALRVEALSGVFMQI